METTATTTAHAHANIFGPPDLSHGLGTGVNFGGSAPSHNHVTVGANNGGYHVGYDHTGNHVNWGVGVSGGYHGGGIGGTGISQVGGHVGINF